MLSQIRCLSMNDFIVLVPFMLLLLHSFKSQAFNVNKSNFYVKKQRQKKQWYSYLRAFQSWSSHQNSCVIFCPFVD